MGHFPAASGALVPAGRWPHGAGLMVLEKQAVARLSIFFRQAFSAGDNTDTRPLAMIFVYPAGVFASRLSVGWWHFFFADEARVRRDILPEKHSVPHRL